MRDFRDYVMMAGGKEIKGCDFFKVQLVVQDIEKIFFCKVGSRTCFETLRDVETSVFVDTADYSHGLDYSRRYMPRCINICKS